MRTIRHRRRRTYSINYLLSVPVQKTNLKKKSFLLSMILGCRCDIKYIYKEHMKKVINTLNALKARIYSSPFLCKTIKQYFTSLNVFILILRNQMSLKSHTHHTHTQIYPKCYALCLVFFLFLKRV